MTNVSSVSFSSVDGVCFVTVVVHVDDDDNDALVRDNLESAFVNDSGGSEEENDDDEDDRGEKNELAASLIKMAIKSFIDVEDFFPPHSPTDDNDDGPGILI